MTPSRRVSGPRVAPSTMERATAAPAEIWVFAPRMAWGPMRAPGSKVTCLPM